MKGLHGILFAYVSNIRLKELTEMRTASSIPFGGRYRVVDFMLSNMVNAGVTDVGVIMRENYQSLLDHLGSGKDWDLARKRGGLRLLPPFACAAVRRGDSAVYRGKLEALNAVAGYINYIRQDHVVLADADLIVNLPLEEIFQKHLESGSDLTCVCSDINRGYDSDAYLRLDREGRVTEVLLSPFEEGVYPCIGVYILKRELLANLMAESAAHNFVDFTRDVMQRMNDRLNLTAYIHYGFSARLQSVADYFVQSMKLLDSKVRSDLFFRQRPIKTKVRDEASTYYGENSSVKNCVVADGCTLMGELENCIVFRGVHVEEGTVVKNSILMQGSQVGAGSDLAYVIADKEVKIGKGRSLRGHDTYPIALTKGACV